MRIAIGQLSQETNTLNPLPTLPTDYEPFGIYRGTDLVERMAETNELGGFIQSLRTWPEQPEIAGLVRLYAWPSGMATRETGAWLRQEVVAAVERVLPVDGVLLALHGAMVAQEMPDVEGEVLESVRRLIGPAVPLVATLDLHANVTARMVTNADALALYHTAPHLDVFETGQRGTVVLRRILIDGARPATAFRKLPLVVPAERANTQDPRSVSHGFRERLQRLEADPRILSAGLATVQPWLDIPELGTAVVVVADRDFAFAEKECRDLAADVWARRHDYLPDLVDPAIAVRRAHEASEGLTVLSDSADATTSGAPGDSTWLLREMVKYHWTRPALVTLVAPDLVVEAQRRGVGTEWTVTLGGRRDPRFAQPLMLPVRVAGLFEARFVLSGHLSRNLPIDMGPSAVLEQGNVKIVVTSRTGPHFAPDLFRAAGFDPFAAQLLIAKSPCGFRAAYEGHARAIEVVRVPGCAPSDFWHYPYHRIPRPLWPWDEITDWQA